ncbi:DNA methyltransferase [Sulfuricurvum sp.]|uniref:class I SAM-dependent DNA methyltransferase n=1 Tax=Sulfuricurvum sp. TaxID=2025608 RepID=UPI00263375C0|nr:DNA methyltransferase [Sulfuricurvum sp.]MDD4950583.1 N-6 DNA methylase [Sulfuricurvum sp.]
MNIAQIESNLQELIENFTPQTFVFDLLSGYGFPKAAIARLEKGDLNQLESKGELTHRKQLFFKVAPSNELHALIDELANDQKASKNTPRFIIVTDYETLLAVDTKTKDTLDIKLLDLTKHYDFFLPWAGMERAQHKDENPADVKAAEKMAKLYDEIVKENAPKTHDEVHALNVFLTRLLFCYFAEDTNIFADNQFTKAIDAHTQVDGSDLDAYLQRLFDVLNTEKRDELLPEYLKAFPYVNGGLFRDRVALPRFTMKSRNIMIEVGTLNWSEINPDIFGSMIQAVVTPEHRGGMGMHYTSIPNIMKVIEPLFLNDFYEEFEQSKENKNKLLAFHGRLTNLKIFDPACGSGNFLIIAYKELRKLEMKIFKQIDALASQRSFAFSEIKLSQFYGIELDDFAHEVAILSLWLAEHQMNLEFFRAFGRTSPTLQLHQGGNIVQGNATRLNWEEVCPKEDGDEIYILGNPPYVGSRIQDDNHKEDMEIVFKKDYKSIDYIACWFYKGANYIRDFKAKLAFVSTNSISQGEQVALVWPRVLNKNLEIFFAHQSFKWTNNAKANAAVIVVIIGIRNIDNNPKYLFKNNFKFDVKNISPYLMNGKTIFIQAYNTPISNLPEINFGNMPADGGKLLLTTEEKNRLIEKEPNSAKWIKKLISSREFLNGQEKWCLWLEGISENTLLNLPLVKERVDAVREIRKKSSRPKLAEIPHLFAQITQPANKNCIVIPKYSSENRRYIPIGYFDSEHKTNDSCFSVATNDISIFGILTSEMHMVWMRAVGGRLKTDYRYSKDIVFNSFPFPNISDQQKEMIAEHVFNILHEREQHSEKTLAQLYDPDKMPSGLREAHHQLDLAIERCYRVKPFESDEERLEYLFKMYEEMTGKEGK